MVGRGAAYADMDGDGDLDVVLTQVDGPARLLRNDQSTGHHWLRVRLNGRSPNTQAVGAKLVLRRGDHVQERTLGGARSYLSHTELAVTFGVGSEAGPAALEVTWPDGSIQSLEGVTVDRTLVVEQP